MLFLTQIVSKCWPKIPKKGILIHDFGFEIDQHQLCDFKGALSGLRQFLATESPLKMTKNHFYFTLKALFVLKIFKFLS